jgi:adenosylhomocysteinase
MAASGTLAFPVISVSDSAVKLALDNTHGTGQSTIDGIVRATGILLAGKIFVVGGFGHVARGIAVRARGMGARVIVTETLPTAALRAAMEGFTVRPMAEAARVGDIFCTATGMCDVITGDHLDEMKDGAILANAGHFDREIDLQALADRTVEERAVRGNTVEHVLFDGRRLYLLADGRVVNLVAAEGNPSEVMDATFAAQLMALLRLVGDRRPSRPGVYYLSAEDDEELARMKLATLGISTDR